WVLAIAAILIVLGMVAAGATAIVLAMRTSLLIDREKASASERQREEAEKRQAIHETLSAEAGHKLIEELNDLKHRTGNPAYVKGKIAVLAIEETDTNVPAVFETPHKLPGTSSP